MAVECVDGGQEAVDEHDERQESTSQSFMPPSAASTAVWGE